MSRDTHIYKSEKSLLPNEHLHESRPHVQIETLQGVKTSTCTMLSGLTVLKDPGVP